MHRPQIIQSKLLLSHLRTLEPSLSRRLKLASRAERAAFPMPRELAAPRARTTEGTRAPVRRAGQREGGELMLLPALWISSALLPLPGSLSCSPSTSRAAVLVHVPPALDWGGGTGAKARSPTSYPVQRSKASRKPNPAHQPLPRRAARKAAGEALPLLPRAGTFPFLPSPSSLSLSLGKSPSSGFNLKRAGEAKSTSESTLPIRLITTVTGRRPWRAIDHHARPCPLRALALRGRATSGPERDVS